MRIKPQKLLLRCYANKDGDQWQAFCIDFCLSAQGGSFNEVRSKLNNMIAEYLYDALAGEDREYAEQLLQRKAPAKQIVTYHYYRFMHAIGAFKDGVHRLFKAPMALVPHNYVHE